MDGELISIHVPFCRSYFFMRPSRYLQLFPYPPDPDFTLLFSTKNGGLALLPTEDCEPLAARRVPKEYGEVLAELGMAVTDQEKEQQEVENLLAEINRADTGLNVALILGMACNFACPYCYEGTQKKDGRKMESETAVRVVAFLQQRYADRARERLTLDFYGGEPLLYTDTIKAIARPLKKYVEQRGGKFRFSLVTNGSLLTRETVQELVPCGLYAAKVTVDGPPDEHNRLRPFASGKPSFQAILANIKECCDLIKIGFGGNYTAANYQRIPELFDSLEGYGLSPANLSSVQFHPVIQTRDQYSNPEFTGGCLSVDEPWVAEASVAVRRAVLERGFRTPKMSPSPCMVDLDDAFVINHDGALYKCVAMIGHQEYMAGDIWHGFTDYALTYSLGHWQKHPECRECAYLPLCFGGCRHAEFQRTGSMAKVDCMRTFLDRVLEESVQQDALYQAERDNNQG